MQRQNKIHLKDRQNKLQFRIKRAQEIQRRLKGEIGYEIVTNLNDEYPIDEFRTIQEARQHIKDIAEYTKKVMGETPIRLFIRPVNIF